MHSNYKVNYKVTGQKLEFDIEVTLSTASKDDAFTTRPSELQRY